MAFSNAKIGAIGLSRSARAEAPALQSGTRFLNRDEVIRLERRSGIKCIKVKSGSIWLTSTPASGDVLLGAGDTFECEKQWPYVLQALSRSELLCSYE
jgi:hypothetical protein